MENGYFRVWLPDGRRVNVMTEQGANAFVRVGIPFIEARLYVADEDRMMLSISNMSNVERRIHQESLVKTYLLLSFVAGKATGDVYRTVGSNQLDLLVSHCYDNLSLLAKSKQWIQTGMLQKHDQELLETLVPNTMHLLFVERVLKSNLLSTLANLAAARSKTDMPCPNVTGAILSIANNIRLNLSFADHALEDVFKHLESSGILAQVLRSITQPSPNPQALPAHLDMMDHLMKCPALVKKKLKPGTLTGDILANIIAGKDGFKGRRDDRVMMRLRNLQAMSTMANSKEGRVPVKSCRNCFESESLDVRFKACGGCKVAFYSSKDCQRADWKAHKRLCYPQDKGLKKSLKGSNQTISSFVMSNYCEIMRKIVSITEEENIDKQELVLELDFFASDGSAPALRDPAEFKVGVMKRYVEGDRPDEPDWFFKGTEVYDRNIKSLLKAAAENRGLVTSNHLLCLVRHASGGFSVKRRMVSISDEGGATLFSNDAYDAFSRALKSDYSRLEEAFGANGEHIRKKLETEKLVSNANDFMSDALFRVMFEGQNVNEGDVSAEA